MSKIAIGCDPNAAGLKKTFIRAMESWGHTVKDFGSDDPIYANVAISVSEAVARNEYDEGILLCGTGIGMSISANKVRGIRAALVTDVYSAVRAKKSNNANVMCLGAFTIGESLALELLKVFLESSFTPGTPSQVKVDRYTSYDENRG